MKTILLRLIIPAIIVAIAAGHSWWQSDKYEREIRSLKIDLAHASIHVPLERDTITLPGDTVKIEVATSKVIRAELEDLRKQHLVDADLIKAMGYKIDQLEAAQTTVVETRDSARAESVSNKVFSYIDGWSNLQFNLQDSTFYYNIRDSLKTTVFREYKHRFLWFRWGTKGYKVKIMNFNPHSKVLYNTYIVPEDK